MSAELSPELAEIGGLRECFAEILASHEEFHRFFSEVFSELDVLSAELVRRQQAWASERSRTETELQQRSARLEADRAALAAAREQVSGGAPPPPDSELQARLEQMEQHRAQIDQERSVLESELDMVRTRAAEMAETLAQQQRDVAEERQRWAAELKRMRQVLEALSARQIELPDDPVAGRNARLSPPLAERSSESPPVSRDEGDPVLSSVMAQFAMLQKDIVRRRRDAAKSN